MRPYFLKDIDNRINSKGSFVFVFYFVFIFIVLKNFFHKKYAILK